MAKRFDAPAVQEGITWLVSRGYENAKEVELEYELVQFENERYLQSFVNQQQQQPPRRRALQTTAIPSFDRVIDLDEYERLMNE